MRLLDARSATLDLLFVVIFLLAPLVRPGCLAIAYTLAAVHLVQTLLTLSDGTRGDSLPRAWDHRALVGVFLVILPTIAGYGPGSPARLLHRIGAVILVIWILTDYRTVAPRAPRDLRPSG
jgi:hypothetical protein